VTGKNALLMLTVRAGERQHSDQDSTMYPYHPSLDHWHCGYSSQDWQNLGHEAGVDRLASEPGNIASETGTPLIHPLTMQRFFANTACFLVCGRRCSVAQQYTKLCLYSLANQIRLIISLLLH